MAEQQRPLKVFLCHASGDKPVVRGLYQRLVDAGVDAWLDAEKLLPGQDWQVEIPRAVRNSDVVVVCLSQKSVNKEGYIRKEIKFALDIAQEKLDDTIFLIPSRLEECEVPESLSQWQWVDLFSENGYERLMRSLQRCAERVGAVINPLPDDEFDEDLKEMLKQLFIEGRAAFLVENWDKAIHRFRKILSLKPNYPGAFEQLTQAEHEKALSKRYVEGVEAYREQNWRVATSVLGELLKDSPNYKDASKLFEIAKKQKQLFDLYMEAQQLHVAGQWQAVIKVFTYIAAIEPNYPDSAGLLLSAQKEVAELNRLAELNELYSQSVSAIDAGQWYEARRLLEQVHKAQRGFLETEPLLAKVEKEILGVEERKKRNIQINTLYEQAHGLIRSKNWREALGKMNEIQGLDPQFEDKDEIAETARAAAELDEQEVKKQNELAALYAESIRLLKEEKYQEALDKWQEVKAIDPKYFDHRKVQKIALKEMSRWNKSFKWGTNTRIWIGVFLVILALGSLLWRWGVPVRSSIDESAYIFSDAESVLPRDDFKLAAGSSIYLCKYDISAQKYLFARSFGDCKSNKTVGWIRKHTVSEVFLINFIYKQP